MTDRLVAGERRSRLGTPTRRGRAQNTSRASIRVRIAFLGLGKSSNSAALDFDITVRHTYLLPFLLTIAFFSLAPKAIGSASLAAFSISAGSAKYELAYRS